MREWKHEQERESRRNMIKSSKEYKRVQMRRRIGFDEEKQEKEKRAHRQHVWNEARKEDT